MKNKMKKFISLSLIVFMILFFANSETLAAQDTKKNEQVNSTVGFTDTKSHWAEDSINDMHSRKIITGYADNTFHPDAKITRAEFSAIIVRALKVNLTTGESFSDVIKADWYGKYVITAATNGLISGYSDGTFRPEAAMTREQAMITIDAAMKIAEISTNLTEDEIFDLLSVYADSADISKAARKNVAVCLNVGVINGRGNLLAPQKNITRAEAAVAIQRLLMKSASNYSSAENWLSIQSSADKPVDVFYLYPSYYSKKDKNDPDVCNIDNVQMRAGARLGFEKEATAFETVGNIYAPFYRQADAVTCLSLPLDEQDKLLSGATKADVFAAFDYYVKNYNKGRPFILAGHSQGSNMLLYLLSEYMSEHPDVYQRMVAAYVIGYSVTKDYMAANPHLKFAESADDTGVIISYNTQSPGFKGVNSVVLLGAMVINPITWTRNETVADASKNQGSILLDKDGSVVRDDNGEFKRIMNYADAGIDNQKGVLICSTVDAAEIAHGNAYVESGVFHIYDYPFYYYNIRENAEKRAEAFMKSRSISEYGKAYAIGLQAYIYGLPLLETNKTFLSMTSIDVSKGAFGPVNQFNHVRAPNDPNSKAVVAPGANGLSSIAWLDLTDEPQVLHVPQVADHYFVLALLDPYTEDISNLGSAQDTPAGDYVICGPGQHGVKVPSGTSQIAVDYTRIWIIGSTQLKGAADITNVNKIQDGFTLTPLSKYGKNYKAPALALPNVDIKRYDIPTGLAFFDTLCQLLKQFPPPEADKSMLEVFASMGIDPGKTPSTDVSLSAETIRGLTDAVAAGPAQVKVETKNVYAASAKIHNGYFLGGFGSYGTNYKLRAIVTAMGLGAMSSDQAIFALTLTDQNMQPLNGSGQYVMHMSAAPPATEGWSITVYDTKGALIQNSINRYQFNDSANLTRNVDGSVDIFFQADQPTEAAKAQNWLPVAKDQGFQVIFRLIAPEKDSISGILDGSGWQPTALTSVSTSEK